MEESIKVLIADDHLIIRQGIIKMLDDEFSIEVIGEANDGREAAKMAQELMPDVILMDLYMPGGSGLLATREIISQSPHARIVMLTVSESRRDLIDCIKAGAVGYITKDASREKLIEAVKAAAKGETIISSSLAADLLDEFKKLANEKQKEPGIVIVGVLTEREVEILKLMAQGLDNKAISKKLFVSEGTIKIHVSNILTKLQLQNRVQAGVLAAKEGLV